jgi:hypothetical protein
MTEEIAHVSGSTADTPGHVGRVSNVLNQTTTERRASPKGKSSIGATQTRERQCKTNTTHTAQYRYALAPTTIAIKAG